MIVITGEVSKIYKSILELMLVGDLVSFNLLVKDRTIILICDDLTAIPALLRGQSFVDTLEVRKL